MSQNSVNFGTSVVAVAAVFGLALVINVFVGSALHGHTEADMSAQAVKARIEPVAKLNTGAPIAAPAPSEPAKTVAAPAAARSGEQVYNQFCQACHVAGVAGAPKVGTAADWAPRIAQGVDALLTSATNGKNAMPPKGTCGDCSADELRGAIEYMVSKSQ